VEATSLSRSLYKVRANVTSWAPVASSLLRQETMVPRKGQAGLMQPLRNFMTPSPHSIGRAQPLNVAQERMRHWGIRHLPVLDGGKLVGILSQRDALLVETLRDVDPAKVPVEDAMTTEVYLVSPDAPLGEVAGAMSEHKYGCAVVMEGAHLAGIFTTVDALRALITVAQGAAAPR
jgi:acetoin utilization protein AcuB